MRKHLFAAILLAVSATAVLAQVDLDKSDKLFNTGNSTQECINYLESVLPQAQKGHERAEVLWRLSRAYLIIGQEEPDKEKKREIFGKGMEYASMAILEDPKNPECYMWHSGNVGRECQTRNFTEQARKLPVIMSDVTTILDDMKMTDFSAAWQTMAEIYMNHPLKSNDEAINFARKAVMTIPEGELRISAYTLLAKLLYERDWNPSKRSAYISKNTSRFKESYKSVTDKYAYFDGSLGTGHKPAWSARSLGEMSDREEAKLIVTYVRSKYNASTEKSGFDKADFKELTDISSKW